MWAGVGILEFSSLARNVTDLLEWQHIPVKEHRSVASQPVPS
jgi:hypothetical protein